MKSILQHGLVPLLIYVVFAPGCFAQMPGTPVALWNFNGNSLDVSGNGYDAIIHGEVSLTTDLHGNPNSAYYFHGTNGWMDLTDNFDYPEISVALWYSVDTVFNMRIIYTNDNPTIVHGQLKIIVDDEASSDHLILITGAGANQIRTDIPICQKNWYHVAMAANDQTVHYYMNGVLVETVDRELGSSANGMINAKLGSSRLPDRFFKGKIDEVVIYNRVITQKEVLQLYSQGLMHVDLIDTCEVAVYDSIAVTDTLFIDVDIAVGVNPPEYSQIKIYPNPARDFVVIQYADINALTGYSVRIVNSLGQQIVDKPITQEVMEIDIRDLGAEGVYFVSILNPSGSTVETRNLILR